MVFLVLVAGTTSFLVQAQSMHKREIEPLTETLCQLSGSYKKTANFDRGRSAQKICSAQICARVLTTTQGFRFPCRNLLVSRMGGKLQKISLPIIGLEYQHFNWIIAKDGKRVPLGSPAYMWKQLTSKHGIAFSRISETPLNTYCCLPLRPILCKGVVAEPGK